MKEAYIVNGVRSAIGNFGGTLSAVRTDGLPVSVPGQTINRLCASGLAATMDAARYIKCGEADLMIAAGVENMTRGPWVMSKASTPFGRDQQLFDTSFHSLILFKNN